jgi:DNA-binding SARP family transcriptional activator
MSIQSSPSRAGTGPAPHDPALLDPARTGPNPPFRVLGPLEVRGPEPVVITARRQRIVLALLLLEGNRVVGLETMVHAVWGSSPPTTARAQVQTAVSALRRTLEQAGLGKRIRMQGLGYAIELAPGELDLHIFDDLVATGRIALREQSPAAARTAFRQALALWRGEPLSAIDSGALQAKLVQTFEKRFEALEECIDAELQLGLHHEVLGEVGALVSEYPLRERPAGQLMTALYRCGRQAEALATYRKVRQTFIDELGLEPSPALHRLELSILNGSADLDPRDIPQAAPHGAAMPVPRMLPARVPDFTGHRALLQRIGARLVGNAGATDPVRVAVITGCAGVGKSALAVEAAHELAPSFPDGQLYARIPRGATTRGHIADVLERFLRALGFNGSAVPDSLEGRAALYRSAIAERHLLIVVEDAVEESQLRALIPGTTTCQLIVTSRARLSGLAGATVFELDVPSVDDGVELLAAMAGRDRVAAEPSEAIELVELCDGLPLALRAAAARLSARPHWNFAQLTDRLRDENRRLDELSHQGMDVRAALGSAYNGLSAPAKLLFARLGGLPSADFAAWVAAPLLDLESGAATDVLESLADARLIDVLGGSGATARYRLRSLVRLYVHECLSAQAAEEFRAARRRMLGAWLSLADTAVLRLGGIPTGEHSDPTRWALDRPLVDAILADPSAWYDLERSALLKAVRQAAETDEIEHCWNLAVAVGALAESQRHYEDWRDSNVAALQATRHTENRLGEAALLYSLGSLDLCEHRWDQAAARLRVALDAFEQLGAERWTELTGIALDRLSRARDGAPQGAETTVAVRRGDPKRDGGAAAGTGTVWENSFQRRQFGLAASRNPEAAAGSGSGQRHNRQSAAERRAIARRAPRVTGSAPSRQRTDSPEER